jgi:parafibromin
VVELRFQDAPKRFPGNHWTHFTFVLPVGISSLSVSWRIGLLNSSDIDSDQGRTPKLSPGANLSEPNLLPRHFSTMADLDSLLLLREAIAAKDGDNDEDWAIPTASADPGAPRVDLAEATHLRFPRAEGGSVTVPMTTPTRLVVSSKEVNLRSVYFAWLNREIAIPAYNEAAATLNANLKTDGTVQNLLFVERVDLISWLEGAGDESEYIKPLEGAAAAAAAARAGKGAQAGMGRGGKGTLDPRLAAVYSHERRHGDRNSILRGIKPTVCACI